MFEFVDDADVRRPSDDQRHEEVNDAGRQHIAVIRISWSTSRISRPSAAAQFSPHEIRDIERQVIDPYADDNSCGYSGFESTSTNLLQSQKSTEQLHV